MNNKMMKYKNILLIMMILSLFFSCRIPGENTGQDTATDDGIIPSDRRINWEPGIPGGIPERNTLFVNVTDPPYNASGDGITDDSDAIQQAIDDCPEGEVVYIPAGNYNVTDRISINKGIVIRGDGPESTKLLLNNTDIVIGGYGFDDSYTVRAGCSKDSTHLILNSVSDINPGDLLIISQENDGEFVTNLGFGGECTWCGDNGNGLGQTLLVTEVNPDNRSIAFESPLYWTYSTGLHPYIKRVRTTVSYAGMEDMYIENIVEGPVTTLMIAGCAYSWLKNIESYNGQRHIEINYSYRCEVRDSYIHHHHNYVPNHYSVLMGTFTTASLIENNVFYSTKGGTIMAAWGACGNVIGYNYTYYTFYTGTSFLQSELTHHGAHPMMNLWEGNCIQKASADGYWGTISHNTFFRNYMRRELDAVGDSGLYNRYAVILEAMCRYFNIIGNVMGFPGPP